MTLKGRFSVILNKKWEKLETHLNLARLEMSLVVMADSKVPADDVDAVDDVGDDAVLEEDPLDEIEVSSLLDWCNFLDFRCFPCFSLCCL